MKSVYLDTNIILAKWALKDPYHQASKKIIAAIEEKKINGYFSGFGLAEVASVVERQKTKFLSHIPNGLSLGIEFIKFIRNINNLEIIEIIHPANLLVSGKKTIISAVNLRVIYTAANLRLKTLDNVHISILDLINRITDKTIDYFITGDKDILGKRTEIADKFQLHITNPNGFPQNLAKV